ncbi:hypothetical protein CC80DRAFT_567312 [Byssothecium circinans]|uniref:Aminoglycoside phosphotransferase domain-containing protein n=1 Tax=Byssothecium circinans TaxID=147558 RepID=A0A6A5U0C0_9PLEO|nr:hypothetical protein CC80DRAFT_567312 [Byssothecium circinans]
MVRTKAEVLTSHFGTTDGSEVYRLSHASLYTPQPQPVDQFCKSLKLPYEAPEHPVLPSLDEINEALTKPEQCFKGVTLNQTCRIRDCVVKIGYGQGCVQEAENILFLREHTQVRVPKLYAVYTRENPGQTDTIYLVTEYIEAKTVQDLWSTSNSNDREIICTRVAEQLRLLRSLPGPSPEYYGRINHQSWTPLFPYTTISFDGVCGPYDSYEDLVDAMYNSVELTVAKFNDTPDWHPLHEATLVEFKPALLAAQDRRPVLSHFDLKLGNVLARPLIEDGKPKDWEVTIIDWDTMGWAPAFLQGAQVINRFLGWFRNHDDGRGEALRQKMLPIIDDQCHLWKVELDYLVDKAGKYLYFGDY